MKPLELRHPPAVPPKGKPHICTVVAGLCSFLAGAQSASAQRTAPPDSVKQAAIAMAALEPVLRGTRIQVHTAALGRIQGSLAAISATSITLDNPPLANMSLGGIDSIWVWQSRKERGALVGGIVGAVFGGLLAIGVGSGPPFCGVDYGNCDPKALLLVKGAVPGAVLGGLLGLAVAHSGWRLMVP
jgi:hypothetical protein